jgi:hypothetical protein
MAAKKLTIRVDEGREAEGLGISTTLKDYRLCFELNRELNIALSKEGVLRVDTQAGLLEVICYFYRDVDRGADLYVMANRQEGWNVLPDMKAADFIALVSGADRQLLFDEIKAACQRITNIQSTFAIPQDKLKSIEID